MIGEIMKHGDIKVVMNEGMPLYRHPFDKGQLIIQFFVNFPEDGFLPMDKIAELQKLLPEPVEVIIPDDHEEVQLVKQEASSHRHRRGGGGREAYYEDDDEDDDGMQGQRVQCASH